MARRAVINNSVDVGAANAVEHNTYAGAKKVIKSGPVLEIMGAIATAKILNQGTVCYLFNNSATVAFVKTSDDGSLPTGITDGIPLKPFDWTIVTIPIGHNRIRSDSAVVGLYIMKDDSKLHV